MTGHSEHEHLLGRSIKRQWIRAGSAGVLIRVLSVLAGLLSSIVLARVLGPEQYGAYSFVIAILAILSIPMQVGLPTLVLRVTAQSKALADWSTLRGIWFWASSVVLAGSVVVIGLFLLWMTFGADTLSEAQRSALLLGLPLAPLLAAGQVRSAALRGLKRIWFAGLPDDVVRPVILASLVLCAGLMAFDDGVTASAAVVSGVIAALFSFLLGTVFLLRSRPSGLIESKVRSFENSRWLRSLVPLSLIGGMQIIMQNTDIIMLGFLRSDEEVGQYRIAVSVSTLAFFGYVVVDLVLMPYFAEAYALEDWKRLQRFATISAGIAFCTTLVVLPVVLFLGEWALVFLYGSPYASSFIPLLLLMVGRVLSAGFGLPGSLLAMSGNETKLAKSVFFAAIANVLLNFLLVPEYGTAGAAVATAISLILNGGLLWLNVRRHMRIESGLLGIARFGHVR